MKIYLAGPVQFDPDGSSVWRDDVKAQYGEQFDFIDPLDKYDVNADDIEYGHLADGDNGIAASKIVESDKEMIRESDAVLIGLRDMVPMYGTPREHEYAASVLNIPVAVWYGEGMEISPWAVHDTVEWSTDLRECMRALYEAQVREIAATQARSAIQDSLGI